MTFSKWHGQVEYLTALEMQKNLVRAHHTNPDTPDQILLLEHPPTYTLGVSGKLEHLLLNDQQLADGGFAVHHINRGGDITYHGPGQLVGYPILNLRRLFKARGFSNFKLHGYVRDLEETIIRAISHFGLTGWRYPGYTGVWIGPEEDPRKIAAIGIHVTTKAICSHGFALNVNPDMTHFDHIIPCGIADHGVTSMARETGRSISTLDVLPAVKDAFQELFSTSTEVSV
ncbi:MAG: lipoyl(octanoyl) transferase LipB [Ardenticatenaceae bacterium]|nr:lipoyl(octanoyl) transferase LipB [Ardenticatenaceae bacterium]